MWTEWCHDTRKAKADEGDTQNDPGAFVAPRGKFVGDMTPQEIKDKYVDANEAQVKGIAELYDLGCFKRWSRHKTNNTIDARWVITWKLIGGHVGINCRSTVGGFNNKCQDLDAYAGTIGRSGQRLVNVVAVGNAEFILLSFDVSQAFAKGAGFDEFSELSGQEVSKIEFDVPRADLDCFEQLPDFKDFDPAREKLTMLKPMYGLKDAPRAWRTQLHQVLIQWMFCRQLYSEPELYCVHSRDYGENADIYKQAQEDVAEQHEIGIRNVEPQVYIDGNLQCFFSVRADDITGVARKKTAEPPPAPPQQVRMPVQGGLYTVPAYRHAT